MKQLFKVKKQKQKRIQKDKEFTPERALKLATGVVILGATVNLVKTL